MIKIFTLFFIYMTSLFAAGRGVKKCADAAAADGIMQYLYLLVVITLLIYWVL